MLQHDILQDIIDIMFACFFLDNVIHVIHIVQNLLIYLVSFYHSGKFNNVRHR